MECKSLDVVDGVLYREDTLRSGQLCIVVPTELRQSLLREAHEGKFAGHLAVSKVFNRLRHHVWWKGMRNDVHQFCKACLICSSRKGGQKTFHPPLQTIPVGGPFHRVGVDVLQLPLTERGNKYVIVFVDYFTKWPEAFAAPDQTAETIARLFVEKIVCRHGIPEELLSDRGPNFLSSLVHEICQLLGEKKINTSGYHPQTDGLVEKSKSCDVANKDWDNHLPYLLFAYRVSAQASTRESPFFLMHGRDARVPTETVITHVRSPYAVDVSDYKNDLLFTAWKLAKENIEKAQK